MGRLKQGAVVEKSYAAFVAAEAKKWEKKGFTKEQAIEKAESYCPMYRHHFRELVAAESLN